jgi:hypothetical protein
MSSADAFSTTITEAMVYEAIADVLDPELDESLVKLGFIDRVEVEGPDVTVAFKLPTIPGVRSTHVLLLDHCTDEQVSTNVNTNKSFLEAFPDEAEDNLEELRLIFLRKGFLVRQDTLLRSLQKAGQKVGMDEATLLSLKVSDLTVDEATERAIFTTPQHVIALERSAHTARAYLRRAAALGIHQQPGDLLFTDDHGQAIAPGGLQIYLRQSRAVRMNIMFNTVFCTDMFQTRYGPGAHRALPEGEMV